MGLTFKNRGHLGSRVVLLVDDLGLVPKLFTANVDP